MHYLHFLEQCSDERQQAAKGLEKHLLDQSRSALIFMDGLWKTELKCSRRTFFDCTDLRFHDTLLRFSVSRGVNVGRRQPASKHTEINRCLKGPKSLKMLLEDRNVLKVKAGAETHDGLWQETPEGSQSALVSPET